jgi:serine-type D-Ala-D-Ala carboxypeptidase/endopeptidase
MWMLRFVPVCLAVILGAAAPAAQAAAVDEPSLHALLVERVDGLKRGTAIVVGISSPQGRRIVAYGRLSVDDSRKADGATVFEIASLTKVFTALLLADMTQQKRVKLEAPVSTCLPDGVKVPEHGGRQITFIDLATHTSGLPLRPDNLASQTALNKYAGYTVEQLYEGLAAFQLPRDPGGTFEYSNWGFGLLGNALAHCAGKKYERLLAERILEPLGMRDTTFAPSAAARSRLASPYDAELRPVPNEDFRADGLQGAGGLYSTADDLLNFIEVFLGHGPEPLAASAATMLEPRRPGDDADTRMALGWRVSSLHGAQTIWSSGGSDGYRSFMAVDQQARVAVVALTNGRTHGGVDDIGWYVLDPRTSVARVHRWITLAADVLDRYVGRYRWDNGNFVIVTRQGADLVVKLTNQEPFRIRATAPREFFPEEGVEAQFMFSESGGGPAESLFLNQDGQSFKAARVAEETPNK